VRSDRPEYKVGVPDPPVQEGNSVLLLLNNCKSLGFCTHTRALLNRKVVPLQSDLGRDLESPLNQGVNSGVFGRTWWFVNRWFESPERLSGPQGSVR